MAAKTRRQQLEELIADDPDDALSRYFLAMDYAGAGENEEAYRRFEELFARTPDYVPAYLQAGQLLVRMGQPAQAAEVFRRGIQTARRQGDEHAAGEMEAFLQQLA